MAGAASARPRVISSRSIVIDLPSRSGEEITSRQLVVHGRVAQGIGEVRLVLETRGGKVLATETLDVTGLSRQGMLPFVSTFDLSNPRPGGSLVLFVVAVDPGGVPLDAIRRRFVVGAVRDLAVGGWHELPATRFDE